MTSQCLSHYEVQVWENLGELNNVDEYFPF